LTTKLLNAALDPLNHQGFTVAPKTVIVLKNGQITTEVKRFQNSEAILLCTVEKPLKLLVLGHVREDLLPSPRVTLISHPEGGIYADAETPPLANLKAIKETIKFPNKDSPLRRITRFLNNV
jgi:hypothetical protein